MRCYCFNSAQVLRDNGMKAFSAIFCPRTPYYSKGIHLFYRIDEITAAIGQLHMLQEELKTGTLVAPFDKPLLRKLAHFFIYPKSGEPPRKLRIFLDWLRLQIASEGLS